MRNKLQTMTLTIAAVTLLLFLIALVLAVFNAWVHPKIDDTRESLGFSCGYLYGQRMTATEFIPAYKPENPIYEFCVKIKDRAVANGFNIKNLVEQK